MMDALRSLGEIKDEPFDSGQLDRWLSGKIPRRILAVPFGGPIPAPNAPMGVDLDGEWFSGNTDLFGGHKALLATRDRLVDWTHDIDPAPAVYRRGARVDGAMKGAILGRLVLDKDAEVDVGYWADWWAKVGERRLALVQSLEERGAKLYGSSQAKAGTTQTDDSTGEILVWPMIREAITTSPQNTYAVLPPLKGLLDGDYNLDTVSAGALRAYALGDPDLRPTSAQPSARRRESGEAAARALLEELVRGARLHGTS